MGVVTHPHFYNPVDTGFSCLQLEKSSIAEICDCPIAKIKPNTHTIV
jgi:hypothetical protein